MEKELGTARKLAIGAGAILMDHYQRSMSIDWKAPGDPVTAADREASHHIVTGLRRQFPEHGILCEEEPDDLVRLERPHVWMVDPMDGTREFIDHRDEFSVMIGLAVDGVPVLGAVYQPTSKKLYYAAAGKGAFMELDGSTVALRVSPEADSSRMSMVVSRSHGSSLVDDVQARLNIKESVRMGSVGLKVGLICEARAHLYVHSSGHTKLWDTCGPDAILREAGGRLTDISNNPLRYTGRELRNTNGIIASSGVMHDDAVRITQSVMRGADAH